MLQICWLRSKQIAESHLNLPPRHCEERSDEAIQIFSCLSGLLRGACPRARIRATRWLAMTVLQLLAF
jgi:hypothetical protein